MFDSSASVVIAVPFYVGRAIGWMPDDAVFDHPTLLGTEPTLPRLLRSLERLDLPPTDQVLVAVIVGYAADDLSARAEQWAEALVGQWTAPPGLRGGVLGPSRLEALRAGGVAEVSLCDLRSYGGVRNACLLAALQAGAEVLVLLDDDEEIRDRDLLHRLADPLRRGHADGIGGLYMEQGRHLIVEPPPAPWSAAFDPAKPKNEAFSRLDASGAVTEAAFAFGGNMALSARLFSRLPFDLQAPRGEDVDYVISARLLGHRFLLDPSIRVDHHPPPGDALPWLKLRQDAVRFLTLRRKLACATAAGRSLPGGALDPYPGAVLAADLPQRLQRAFGLLRSHHAAQDDRQGAAAVCGVADEVARHARQLEADDPWRAYEQATARWQSLTRQLAGRTACE